MNEQTKKNLGQRKFDDIVGWDRSLSETGANNDPQLSPGQSTLLSAIGLLHVAKSPVTDPKNIAGLIGDAIDKLNYLGANPETFTALQAKCAPREAQPVATLHDDGHWVWKGTPPHESNYAGWRMEVYAAPTPERADAKKDAALTDEQIEAAIEAWFDTDEKDVDDHQSRMRAAILAADKA